MAIFVQLPSGERVTVEAKSAVIGRDAACDIALPGERHIQPRHAILTRVAGKWMIQSEGDWLIQVGDGIPGRKCWVNPNDAIRLSESGPVIVFAPVSIAPQSNLSPSVKQKPDRKRQQPPPLPNHKNEQPHPLWAPRSSTSARAAGGLPIPDSHPASPVLQQLGPAAAQKSSQSKEVAKSALIFGLGAIVGALLNSLGFNKKQGTSLSRRLEGFVRRRFFAVDVDGDGAADIVGMDASGDGRIDTIGVDTDGDGRLDTVGIDTNQDGFVDVVGHDGDGDGQVDIVASDTNYDGNFDRLVADTDHDGNADFIAADLDDDGSIDAAMYEETEPDYDTGSEQDEEDYS